MIRNRVTWMLCALALAATGCSLGASPATLEPTPTTTPSAPAIPADGGDGCLIGTWSMDTAAADQMLASLTGVTTLHVAAGSLTLAFDAGRFHYGSVGVTVRTDLPPSGYIEAEATFASTGGFSAEGGMLTFNTESVTNDIGVWRAVINGETAEVPGGGPVISFSPPGSAPYRCSADLLEVLTRNPAGAEVSMTFVRSG